MTYDEAKANQFRNVPEKLCFEWIKTGKMNMVQFALWLYWNR